MTKKLYSFRLPPDLMDALREKADEEEISVTELLTRLIGQSVGKTEHYEPLKEEQLAEGLRREIDKKMRENRHEIQVYLDEKIKELKASFDQKIKLET